MDMQVYIIYRITHNFFSELTTFHINIMHKKHVSILPNTYFYSVICNKLCFVYQFSRHSACSLDFHLKMYIYVKLFICNKEYHLQTL